MLTFLQGRNSEWVRKPFFAKYDEDAMWLDELVPAFEEDEFFFDRKKKVIPIRNSKKTVFEDVKLIHK